MRKVVMAYATQKRLAQARNNQGAPMDLNRVAGEEGAAAGGQYYECQNCWDQDGDVDALGKGKQGGLK